MKQQVLFSAMQSWCRRYSHRLICGCPEFDPRWSLWFFTVRSVYQDICTFNWYNIVYAGIELNACRSLAAAETTIKSHSMVHGLIGSCVHRYSWTRLSIFLCSSDAVGITLIETWMATATGGNNVLLEEHCWWKCLPLTELYKELIIINELATKSNHAYIYCKWRQTKLFHIVCMGIIELNFEVIIWIMIVDK